MNDQCINFGGNWGETLPPEYLDNTIFDLSLNNAWELYGNTAPDEHLTEAYEPLVPESPEPPAAAPLPQTESSEFDFEAAGLEPLDLGSEIQSLFEETAETEQAAPKPEPQVIEEPVVPEPQVAEEPVVREPQVAEEPVVPEPQIAAQPVMPQLQFVPQPIVVQPQGAQAGAVLEPIPEKRKDWVETLFSPRNVRNFFKKLFTSFLILSVYNMLTLITAQPDTNVRDFAGLISVPMFFLGWALIVAALYAFDMFSELISR